jgi:hypothetical protein
MRGLLLFLLGALSASTLVFLGASDFFTSWEGSVRNVRTDELGADDQGASRLVVSIEDERPGGLVLQRSWPGDLVRELTLPTPTRKSRYTMHFLVQDEGSWRTGPTTSPQGFGLSLMVLALLVAVRNMTVSGLPWLFSPRERYHATQLPPTGQAVPTSGGSGPRGPSKQGPPPSRPKVGRGKR